MLREFLNEYLSRSKEALDASESFLKITYPYSVPVMDASHDLITLLVEETKKFCLEKGLEIDRISFISVYDTDLHLDTANRIKADNDVILKVVKKPDGQKEAVVFLGSWLETHH